MGKENFAMIVFLLIAATMVQDTLARASEDLIIDKDKVEEIKAGADPPTHPVGGDKGWDVGVDYKAWAATQDIRAGDYLYFRYDRNIHNIYVVHAKQFEECSTADPIKAYLPGCGSMGIPVGNAGDWYFISGVGDDCKNGMKLHVVVKEK